MKIKTNKFEKPKKPVVETQRPWGKITGFSDQTKEEIFDKISKIAKIIHDKTLQTKDVHYNHVAYNWLLTNT